MTEVKYIAAGFTQDADQLLNDFIRENCANFSTFAKVWRDRHFSLIYMGRASEEELREFTQEIFHLSTQYLTSSLLLRQVGAVYLLYALFRKQILTPPVRIRVVLDQMQLMLALRDAPPLVEIPTFHYVVSYLFDNSLDLVACPKLLGPTIPCAVNDFEKVKVEDSVLKFHPGLKSDMTELAESKILQETGELFAKYTKLKSSLDLNLPKLNSSATESFEIYNNRLSGLLEPTKISLPVTVKTDKPTSNIGSRRALLKSKAFGEEVYPGAKSAVSDEEEPVNIAPYPFRKRIPKPKRNVGRPKKVVKDKEESDSSLHRPCQRERDRKPRRRTCTTTRHYYSESQDLKLLSDYENINLRSNSHRLFMFREDSDVDDPDLDTFEDGNASDVSNSYKDANGGNLMPTVTVKSLDNDSDVDDPMAIVAGKCLDDDVKVNPMLKVAVKYSDSDDEVDVSMSVTEKSLDNDSDVEDSMQVVNSSYAEDSNADESMSDVTSFCTENN